MYKELDIKLNYNYNNEANNNTLSKINSISQLNSNIDICKENNNTYNNYLLPDTISVKKSIKDIVEFTRTGFQGDEEKANNQDIAIIYPNFMDNNEYYFLSVCDGHGVKGHDISGYIKQKLPFNLQSNFITNNLVNIFDSKSKNKLYSCIEEVFIQTNNNLNNNSMIDTNFSGSTCVSLFLSKDKIITANIGDSRAVMGKLINKTWVSKDLSRDHKPSDKDESIRINMKGGRIEPYRDDDGEFIGPSRIWLKEEDLPGLAMSRSFGDMVAASVGCISCPEIFEFDLKEEDKFIIIASDGIWEFITSDECINIIKDFYLKNNAKECVNHLYNLSSHRWREEEDAIDDITIILVFFN